MQFLRNKNSLKKWQLRFDPSRFVRVWAGILLATALGIHVQVAWGQESNVEEEISIGKRVFHVAPESEHQAEPEYLQPRESQSGDGSLAVVADNTSSPCNREVDVWELSTRHLPDNFRCINVNNPPFEVRQFVNGAWQSAALEEALEMGDKLPILYVHGNFMERCNALDRSLIVNRYLQSRAVQPYRLIMLSWPSQRERKPLRDVYDNAESAECQSLYFAWLLEKLSHHPQISILGFSFGARTVTGGLHLASGGSIPGFQHVSVRDPNATTPIYRVGLVAPAIDRNWLTPRGRNSQALQYVDALVNLYNSKDPVLRRFRFIDRLTRPIAAGFAGFEGLSNPRATGPLEGTSHIRQYDCGGVIGTTHSEKSYYGECPYFGILIDNLLWKDPSGQCIPK